MHHRSKTIIFIISIMSIFLVSPLTIPYAYSARDCKAGESEKACTARNIAICVKNEKGFHIDWVMDCIHNAKNLPAKMEDTCQAYHTVKSAYGDKCKDPASNAEVKATCAWLAGHKKGCAE